MSSRLRPASGFTLLEVLVASAVLGMVLVILLGSVTTSLSIWRNAEASMAADREGRSAFQLLADDLANAVVPANSALWPQTNAAGNTIRFLTLKPADYQQATAGDVGDVCFVEYSVRPQSSSNTLVRSFTGSKDTYSAIKNGSLPFAVNPQLLATNVISNNIALKGTAVVRSGGTADTNAIRTNFTLLVLSNGLYSNAPVNTRPDAVQVSIGVADMDTVRRPELLGNTSIPLRAGGFYTFTVNLPSP